ncbi:kielin/chordin-like protein [Procambarus clarkii]|uniref:kielin/chordin-like protein n=1 Tax=Procambarus clarkii TaxID=6728 RepID=UPI0037429DA8
MENDMDWERQLTGGLVCSTEWDILQLLSINGSQTGVSAARGPIPDTPAWRLRALYDNIQLDSSTVPKIASTLHDQLSLYFVYKQHKKTIGSLISINLPGKIKPFLQVISNLKSQHLNFFYHIKEDAKTHQASFKLPDKVGWTWTRLLISVNQTDVRVWVNCADYDKQRLAGHIDLQIPESGLIYFRQEPGLKNKLIGSIQMAKLMNYSENDRVWNCSYDSQFGPGWRPPLIG